MQGLEGMGRLLIAFGILALIVGGLLLLVGKIPGIGRLPGDIYIQRGNFSFYFPVVTSIILSIILSLILNFFLRR